MILSTKVTLILFVVLVSALVVCCILLKLYRSGKWKPKVSEVAEGEVEKTVDLSEIIQAFNDEFGTEDLEEMGIRTTNESLPDTSGQPV